MEHKKDFSKEIALPEGVAANFLDGMLTIKKGKSEASRKLKIEPSQIKIGDNNIIIRGGAQAMSSKKNIGSIASHIKNMVKGVTEGHRYVLKICSGHFPMSVSVSNNKLIIKNFFGEKVPREMKIKEGASVKIEQDDIVVESHSKEIAGQVSADIEQLTRRPGFDIRVFQDGIYLINKDGKELK